MDKLHMALTELCFAINYCSVITVWEHGFVPRDFFTQPLEQRFNKYSLTLCTSNGQPLLSHISNCDSCMSHMHCTLPLEATEDIWTVNSALGSDQQWLK